MPFVGASDEQAMMSINGWDALIVFGMLCFFGLIVLTGYHHEEPIYCESCGKTIDEGDLCDCLRHHQECCTKENPRRAFASVDEEELFDFLKETLIIKRP